MIFLVGSLSFYILVAIVFCILLMEMVYETGVGLTITLALTVLFLSWINHFSLYSYVTNNGWLITSRVLEYLLIGSAWALVKWFLFLKKNVRIYKKLRAEYIRKHNAFYKELPTDSFSGLTASEKDHFFSDVARALRCGPNARINDNIAPPLAVDNKSRIITWIAYWPISIIAFLIDEPVKRTLTFIYESLSGMMDRISNTLYKDIIADSELHIAEKVKTLDRRR